MCASALVLAFPHLGVALVGLAAGTLNGAVVATLQRFAGEACSSDGLSDLHAVRRVAAIRCGSGGVHTIGPPNLSGVRTTGLAVCGTWSFWGLPSEAGRRFAFGGVRKIAAESGVRTWSFWGLPSEAGRHFAFGVVLKIAAESGVRTAVRTAGDERASAAARGVRTTGRAASSVPTLAPEHDPEGLARGSVGAWGCIGSGQ